MKGGLGDRDARLPLGDLILALALAFGEAYCIGTVVTVDSLAAAKCSCRF